MDIKPKHLIQTIIPLIVVVFLSLSYVGYSDLKVSRAAAYQQAKDNVSVANEYLKIHFNSVENHLYLLGQILVRDVVIDEYIAMGDALIANQKKLSEVGLYSQGSYYGTHGIEVHNVANKMENRPWYNPNSKVGESYISPIYMSRTTDKWSVTVVKVIEMANKQLAYILLETDVTELYKQLALLKTMKNGYVYVVDVNSRQIIMHPDHSRIGSLSVSVEPELLQSIQEGETQGAIDGYMYKMRWKFSVYDADNAFGWILLSGTITQDITSQAFNLGAVSITLFCVIGIMVLINLISKRVHNNGRLLTEVDGLVALDQRLNAMIKDLVPCESVILFTYNEDHHEYVDVHKRYIFSQETVERFLTLDKRQSMRVSVSNRNDLIARHISPTRAVFRVPLIINEQLQGIVYLLRTPVVLPWFVNIYRIYAQGALNHVLLRQRIKNKDQMTNLMNKNYLRSHIQQVLMKNQTDYYLAMLDIDDFKMINDGLGHLFGDQVILSVAEKLKEVMPDQAIIARYGGDEFSIMFMAESRIAADSKLQALRRALSQSQVHFNGKKASYTVSVGFAEVQGELDSVISLADNALYKAKKNKPSKVCLHDMGYGPCRYYQCDDDLNTTSRKSGECLPCGNALDSDHAASRNLEAV
ncbi:diguanylate cyclase domain-containing protein [Photobacterium swingsii]|uniref:sensor domain-containing diguanylate cyclase n=1 Tax=Photobacterium swingsii TaxID=680026 RepID=UPI00352EA838